MLTSDDVTAITGVLNLYGHLIDRRLMGRVPEVFTEDARYDATSVGHGVTVGSLALQELLASEGQPPSHQATNLVVFEDAEGAVRAWSKWHVVGRDGALVQGDYEDVLERTLAGWRISERVIVLRSRPTPRPPVPPRR